MSKTIKNQGLAQLCLAFDLQISDIELILNRRRSNIYRYAAGLKPMPRLEAGLADIFALSIPELRKIIFKTGGARYAARRFKVRRRRLIPIWRKDKTGEERFLNGGEKYAHYPIFISTVEALRQRGCGEVRIKTLPFGYIKLEGWTLI